MLISGEEADGKTTLTFKRKINTCDSDDWTVSVSALTSVQELSLLKLFKYLVKNYSWFGQGFLRSPWELKSIFSKNFLVDFSSAPLTVKNNLYCTTLL